MKKVIVSGANGFVGGALVKELIKNNVRVVALDMEGQQESRQEEIRIKDTKRKLLFTNFSRR